MDGEMDGWMDGWTLVCSRDVTCISVSRYGMVVLERFFRSLPILPVIPVCSAPPRLLASIVLLRSF